ncbi:MAG: glycosyltransferase [Flavobacteriales bacterium]|nr:glycosyltransferase [Flavobacteriales bacterium]
MKPLFSVIIPTYNRGDLIEKAITGMITQSFEAWELIIVDDGSTDDTSKRVSRFTDSRIKYVYQENAERSAARNNGIDKAQGDYICFLDSDDHFASNHLQAFHDFIESVKPTPGLMMGVIENVNDRGESMGEFGPYPDRNDLLEYLIAHRLTFPLNACCIHRDVLQETRFDPRFNIWEDSHLAFRILTRWPYYGVKDACVHVVAHEGSGVVQIRRQVQLEKVLRYETAVRDLFTQCGPIRPEVFSLKNRTDYIFTKLSGFFYSARISGQYQIAFRLMTLLWKKYFRLSDTGFYIKGGIKLLLNRTLGIKTR